MDAREAWISAWCASSMCTFLSSASCPAAACAQQMQYRTGTVDRFCVHLRVQRGLPRRCLHAVASHHPALAHMEDGQDLAVPVAQPRHAVQLMHASVEVYLGQLLRARVMLDKFWRPQPVSACQVVLHQIARNLNTRAPQPPKPSPHPGQLLLQRQQRVAVGQDLAVPVGQRMRVPHKGLRARVQLRIPLVDDVLHALAADLRRRHRRRRRRNLQWDTLSDSHVQILTGLLGYVNIHPDGGIETLLARRTREQQASEHRQTEMHLAAMHYP